VLRLAILLRNSADAQAAFDKIDPEKRIISQTEREEIAFLIEHQGCLFPPSSKEKREAAMKGRNGHMQLDIASSGERVNPFEHKRFAEIMDGNESLASAVIALNASQKSRLTQCAQIKKGFLLQQHTFIKSTNTVNIWKMPLSTMRTFFGAWWKVF
jgi:hypothetical protein